MRCSPKPGRKREASTERRWVAMLLRRCDIEESSAVGASLAFAVTHQRKAAMAGQSGESIEQFRNRKITSFGQRQKAWHKG